MINENRLFKLLPYFFSNPRKVLIEIAQNAQRAQATKLDITITEDVLTASDNGIGARQVEPLFVLADTGWDDSVEQQAPAGWGIYFLIAVSREVTFRSLFGSITLDCHMFLNDKSYRDALLAKVDKNDTAEGFHMWAAMDPKAAIHQGDACFELPYFPLDISVNGKPVTKIDPLKKSDDTLFHSTYQGNRFAVREKALNHNTLQQMGIGCIWYGTPTGINQAYSDVVIDVTQGTPLTPVLPYRERIKQDGKLSNFLETIRDEVAKHCVEFINDPANTEDSELKKRMKFLTHMGTQDELDGLTRFYDIREQPHGSNKSILEIVAMGTTLESEELELTVDGEQLVPDTSNCRVFLPEDTVVSRWLPGRMPKWIRTSSKTVRIEIKTQGKPYDGNFTWHNSRMTCTGKEIGMAAVVDDYGNIDIYYDRHPETFSSVIPDVFQRAVYAEDGDQRESQEDDFYCRIEKDVMNITGSFDKSALLDGFSAANINPYHITAINWKKGDDTMTVETESETVTLKVA